MAGTMRGGDALNARHRSATGSLHDRLVDQVPGERIVVIEGRATFILHHHDRDQALLRIYPKDRAGCANPVVDAARSTWSTSHKFRAIRIAEFERGRIRERQREGIVLAKTKGVFKGGKVRFDPVVIQQKRTEA